MNNENKKVGTITLTDFENNVDIFRIHVLDDCIKFDTYFAYGISQNNDVFLDVEKINYQWKNREIKKEEIFPCMVDIVDKHYEYISKFYLRQDELRVSGEFRRIKTFSSKEDKKYIHYMTLKHCLSGLKVISREEFEQNIENEEIGEEYVVNFKKNGCKYYFYQTDDNKNKIRKCFIMLHNKKYNFGFLED